MKNLFSILLVAATAFAASAADNVPAAPTDLKVRIADEFSLSEVALNWTLPTTYTDGTAFGNGVEVSGVKVYRNYKEIARLDGPATSFTDVSESKNPEDGYGYRLNIYEVSACVDGVWSATCLPEQIEIGEYLWREFIPWQPELKNLSEMKFERDWWSFARDWQDHNKTWVSTADGMTYTADGDCATYSWLMGHILDLLPRRTYQIEFTMVADANVLYSVGLTDYYNGETTKFIQLFAGNCPGTPEASTRKIEFVYAPRRGGAPYWPESPTFAINACVPAGSGEVHLTLTDVKVTQVENASAQNVATAAEVTDIEVYNLQGVYMGSADSLSLDGYTPGLYVVRYRSGNEVCSSKVLIR